MIKTLTNLFKQDKEKFVVPKGVQDVIPVVAIFDDGIFKVGKDKYSKTYRFTDINYAVASREDKEAMFLEYSELLNSLDSGATTKITINNRRLNRLDFEQTILIPTTGDNLDEYREEYNKMLLDKATGANSIVQDKYITISINKKSVEDARTYFARVGADLIAHFGRLGSKCVELETDERLRIFHDFYRVGEESSFHFDIKETRKKGHDFKDYICPDTMEFEKDYFKMGNRYGRVLFLREYASYIKDSMVAELTDMNRNLMMSIDIVPVPTDEAVKEAENRLLGVETNITNWQRRQNANNNFSATVPYDMEQQKKEMKEFLDDLTTRDQRMMFAVITMVITADSKEQLENDTEALLTTARKHLCQFATLRFQQVDGLNTVMPFGTRKIDAFRTLTTESLSVFIPFRVQDIFHENGIYYGQNVISKNMIIADRKQLLNGNSFILGVSGGGKSFAAKGEIINQVLSSDADIIIIDPEREYSQLVNAMGGEVINISATSDNHINAMDMNKDYGDGANPVILKSEFIMSLCEQLIGGTNLGAKQKEYAEPVNFRLDELDESKYEAKMYEKGSLRLGLSEKETNIDSMKDQDKYSEFSLTAEIARYMNISCLTIAKILRESVDTPNTIVEAVNRHNEVLEDIIIPEIFHTLYEVKSTQKSEDVDMVLLREPKDAGYYEFSATDELVITKGHNNFTPQEEAKSFHADTYCFDSKPERECFLQYISSNKVKEIYFTGMFTSNQGDLSVQYYDPESKRLRKYYPDFLALMEDGSYQLIEVKGDNKIDDEVVLAKKAAAEEMAVASGVHYLMYAGSTLMKSNVLEPTLAVQQTSIDI